MGNYADALLAGIDYYHLEDERITFRNLNSDYFDIITLK